MKFKINWDIPEKGWEKAVEVRQKEPPGSEYDKACGPHYDLLYGEIQVSYELNSLFPSPQNLSLADLAYGLYYGVVREGFKGAQEGSAIRFQQADDAFEISFKKSRGMVLIISNHPSPFVVLDEVDAALDEANSERYAAILESLMSDTQFITITHNRATMSRASILYGVTMGEDGVSKLLSVKLDQADEMVK